jgi:hypothetical protein
MGIGWQRHLMASREPIAGFSHDDECVLDRIDMGHGTMVCRDGTLGWPSDVLRLLETRQLVEPAEQLVEQRLECFRFAGGQSIQHRFVDP